MLSEQLSAHASLIGWLPLIGVAAFAWWKGDWPERWGGLLNLFTSSCAFVIRLSFEPGAAQDVPMLIADGLLAFGFLALALLYASWWLGGAMLFQAIQFSVHAFYIVQSREHDFFYYLLNNVNTAAVLLMIVIGTIASWLYRVRERRLEAASP